jgi:DNA-binding NarL/FixJ family response regulator
MIAPLRTPVLAGGRYCLLPRPVAPPPTLEPITPAEQDVLAYLCAGYSNKEIAAFLGKAVPTVKHQVSSTMRKLGVQSRCQLIVRLLT